MSSDKQILTSTQIDELLLILKTRFEENMHRHQRLDWNDVELKLKASPEKLFSLSEMERTGGEPDLVGFDKESDQYLFVDCCKETPADRRNLCYDKESWESRKAFKPEGSAMERAEEMGVKILNEQEYRFLQTFGNFDLKTSSWLQTPQDIRKRGGAIFAHYRYGHVFIFHNGAESYYAARGFRAILRV